MEYLRPLGQTAPSLGLQTVLKFLAKLPPEFHATPNGLLKSLLFYQAENLPEGVKNITALTDIYTIPACQAQSRMVIVNQVLEPRDMIFQNM
jgi:hypothetical protein